MRELLTMSTIPSKVLEFIEFEKGKGIIEESIERVEVKESEIVIDER
jgi:hypothetical protein